ncbi:MAG TPA: LytR C-terminal domain-containing protein, partial [Solirubrobacteraceae bacterium]|nr:LytR C-terminal domain-containing protein [Solirubrobacteraceae bacterium]
TYTASRRSPARVTALILGAVVVGIAAIVLVVSLLGSGSSAKSPSTASSASSAAAHTHHGSPASHHASTHASEPSSPAGSPAETQVAVLNGTTAEGLAHRLAISLQQTGYSQATALGGTPPGSHQTTVIEYSAGHHAEAAQVAQTLGVSQVQPIEAAVSPLVGASTVVVIAGLDKAGSSTETSSGAAGEGAAAPGNEGAGAGGGSGSTP